MTVQELIDLLQTVRNKDEEVYVNDRYGYHSTDITLDRWHHDPNYLLLEG